MEEDPKLIEFFLCPVGVRTMLYAVDEALRVWPGGDPAIQENLWTLRTALQAANLEWVFDGESAT